VTRGESILLMSRELLRVRKKKEDVREGSKWKLRGGRKVQSLVDGIFDAKEFQRKTGRWVCAITNWRKEKKKTSLLGPTKKGGEGTYPPTGPLAT